MDIKGSARENAALRITSDWIRDHGRVLIFTQHTDTVTGLLRRIDAEGLKATAFHGSMSAGQRAATIAAFKSGEAPIMISTDAGAEGQNLQFCNCVLNYDLPWNPMRIEQRIGRVDRLTQPRDEVFVANLYARGTVDENVYRLLAEKLRMFELLFGQVTTILGELDDSKSATFESRVLEALFASDDTRMERLLTQLGTELVDARNRASTLIAADSGLSSWMASASEHRKGLTKAGSTELAPEVAERTRIRQRRVQAWVRRVLEALGAQAIHDTGDGEGAFLTVQFDEILAEELGGRTLLHVAFDREGMEHHPDAELCAVGSPVFDELLGLLRVRGDMHATIPVIPDDLGPSPFQHAAMITLRRRRLVPRGTWSGHATFRATVGEAETTEHIITAEIGGNCEVRLPRRPLADGERLSPAFDDPSEMVAAFQRAATKQLDAHRRERADLLERDRAAELDRIRTGYNAQISEAPYDDQLRLRRALNSEEERLGRAPDVRARAKMLAVVLDEDDWTIEETWEGPDGAERTLTYEWGLPELPLVDSEASRDPIKVLALCSAAHWVDERETTQCRSCGGYLCLACGDDGIFADCVACGLPSCGSCRKETGGLCLRCGSPERAPDLDRQFAIAWRLNGGVTLFVGERVAELMHSDSASSLVVRDEDVNDQNRSRLRSYAIQNNLPADSGLILRDCTHRTVRPNPTQLSLRESMTVEMEFSIADSQGSAVDPDAIYDLPVHDAVSVKGEEAVKLATLLAKLRGEVPPPAPPSVLLTRRAKFTDLYMATERLVEQVSVVGTDYTLETVNERSTPILWRIDSVDSALLAEAELAGMRVILERRNDAVLIAARDDLSDTATQWIALPNAASAEQQFEWFDILCSLNAPGGRVGRPLDQAQAITKPFPSPSECQLIERRTQRVAELAPVEAGIELAPADRASLEKLGPRPRWPARQIHDLVPAELGGVLLERTKRSFTTVVSSGFEIHETWRGHGTATHEYRTFDGEPVAPRLDDVGFREKDFGVCRDGHFYASGTASLCASCKTWCCRACHPVEHQASIACSRCTAAVCRGCLSAEHSVSNTRCALCDDTACIECGRDPEVLACSICDRMACAACRLDGLCGACTRLAPASDDQKQRLPRELAAAGATVLVGLDSNAISVLLDRGNVFEQAVIRDGLIDRWVAFGRRAIGDAYRLRLAASRQLGTQVIPVVESPNSDVPFDGPHIIALWERSFRPSWSAKELGISGRCRNSFANTDADLMSLIADEFAAPTRLPSPMEGTPSHVDRAFANSHPPETFDLTLRWNRAGHDVAITPSGITERTINSSDVSDTVTAWDEPTTACAWITELWSPLPRIRAHAVSETAEAVIVSLASMVTLGVRVGERSHWYTITDSPLAAQATALARSMGLADADEVSDFVDPSKVRLSSVLNATEVTLNTHPVGTVKPAVQHGFPGVTVAALNAWMPTARLRTPEFGSLPYEFTTSLQQQIKVQESRTELAIGARVEQTARVDGGVWKHQVKLVPGHTDARQLDSRTVLPLDAGVIDREGHFGPDGTRCAYCEARVCPVCVDGLASILHRS